MTHRLVLLLFFVSGALGIGYQVLWSRYVLGFIGVSAYSYATVLAAFMAGLALGSALLGRVADRVSSPLRLFALLEAGVGLYALVYPALSELASGAYSILARSAVGDSGGTHGLWARALIAGALLLGPTTLMGGTYPALVRHATEELGEVRRRASQLYAVNAAGAVMGALSMAFVLLPAMGLRTSLACLALVNGLVALAALLLARRTSAGAPPIQPPSATTWAVRVALLLIFVEGALAFTLEVAWTRFFSVVLGSSTYAFALVLAVFLAGIGLGSAWLSGSPKALRRLDPLGAFGWTQVLAGLFVIVPLATYPRLPWVLLNLGALFSEHPVAFYAYSTGQLLVCALIMLPPTLLLGMALPLLIEGLARDMGRLGSDAGRVYAWNTWGNVVGALLAGLVLLPLLGMERLLRGTALGLSVVGVVALVCLSRRDLVPWRRLVATGAVLAICHLAVGSWQTEAFALRPTRRPASPPSWRAAEAQLASYRTVLFVDDPAALLMVHETKVGRQEGLTLSLNGKPDATTYEDLPTQILLGHVPLLLAPEPRDVLLIGLASGITAGSVLAHPIRRLDVVDIVAAMPLATRLFAGWNRDPLADSRLRLIVDDARSYLSHAGLEYDVIVSEPSNPWMAGTGALFTREYYELASSSLTEDGVYLQWLQAYELTDETFAAVVRTFRGAFPHVYGFQGNADDVLLLGARRPLQLDVAELDRRLTVPAVREDLERIGAESAGALLAFQTLSPISVDSIAARTTLENTDDNLLLEHRAPRELFSRARVELVSRLDERLHGGNALLLGELLRRRPGSVSASSLLQALSDPRVRSQPLQDALEIVTLELEPAAAEPPLFAPMDAQELAERAAALVAEGREERAWRLVSSRSAALLLETMLSQERASFWTEASRTWLKSPTSPPLPELRRMHIEILAAAGRRRDASMEIEEWMEEVPGPEPIWLVLLACAIDPGPLCDKTLRNASSRTPSLLVPRLQALRPTSP